MCNLDSITTNQAAIAAFFRVIKRYVGNLPPMSGVFPAYPETRALRDINETCMLARWKLGASV